MARQIYAGTIDVDIEIKIIDSTDGTPETGVVFNTAGIDLWYRRNGAALVSITEVTLAALTTAHTDGGFLHIKDGMYRLDLPDAACAAGANHVVIGGTVTGMVVIGELIELVLYNPYDAVRMGLLALPANAAEAAGGMFTRGTGAGQINQTANGMIDSNVVRWLNSVVNALLTGRVDASVGAYPGNTPQTGDNFPRIGANGAGLSAVPWNASWDTEVQSEVDDALVVHNLDHLVGTATGIPAAPPADTFLAKIMDNGTIPYQRSIHSLAAAVDNSADIAEFGILVSTTIATVSSQTVFTLTAGSSINDSYLNRDIALYDLSNGLYPSVRKVADYVGSTRTVTLDSAPDFTIATGQADEVRIFVSGGTASGGPTAVQIADEVQTRTMAAVTLVNGLAANSVNASALATDAVTEIQAGLSTVTTAQVRTEVIGALNTDTYAEPGQGAPPATATLVQKIGWVYKAWRNRTTATSTQYSLYNDNTTTVDAKATLSDSAGTTEKSEIISGP